MVVPIQVSCEREFTGILYFKVQLYKQIEHQKQQAIKLATYFGCGKKRERGRSFMGSM